MEQNQPKNDKSIGFCGLYLTVAFILFIGAIALAFLGQVAGWVGLLLVPFPIAIAIKVYCELEGRVISCEKRVEILQNQLDSLTGDTAQTATSAPATEGASHPQTPHAILAEDNVNHAE